MQIADRRTEKVDDKRPSSI